MLKMNINKEYMNSLFFDALQKGKSSVKQEGNDYSVSLTEDEFNSFLKDNNIITYKNVLKFYENGEVVGSFEA